MKVAQISPAVARPASAAKPLVQAVGAPSHVAALQRCGSDCGCASCKGSAKPAADDKLARTLRTAVEDRALQRATSLQAPPGVLQRACTSTRLSQLQAQMHNVCDSGISCRRSSNCNDVNDRMQAGYDCYDLRQQIQSECYDNQTDAGHAEQLQNVQNAIDGCVDKWNRWRCR